MSAWRTEVRHLRIDLPARGGGELSEDADHLNDAGRVVGGHGPSAVPADRKQGERV